MSSCNSTNGNGNGGNLKDLSFEAITATILNISQDCGNRVLICWRLKRTAQNLQNLRYYILRGESPEEMSRISEPILPTDVAEYVDYTAHLLDFHKIYYYQVEAVELDGTGNELQSFKSDPVPTQGITDAVQNYIINEHLFLYQFTSAGIPVAIYKKRHDGIRCPNCWDDILKRSTRSNCQTCYGTGKMDGYYPPIEAFMGIDPSPDQSQVQMWGELQPSQTTFRFTNYPYLHVNDLILELRTNDLWKITQTNFPERNRVRTLQNGVVDEVNRTDVEYKLDFDETRRKEIVSAHDARVRGDMP